MDVSGSAFNLNKDENEKAIARQRRQDEQFNQIITSCTSLSKYESKRFKTLLPQILATLISASYHIVFGISLAYSAVLIPELENADGALRLEKGGVVNGFVASIIIIVVPVASLACGFVMDSIGRLNTLKLTTIPVSIGWILIATAQNIPTILVGRLLTGISGSFATSPAIVYITEIARVDMRGSLISAAPAYASLGMVLAYLKGWFMDYRTIAWSCLAWTIAPLVLIQFLIPESPPWLISKGRVDEARRSLEWLNRYHPRPSDRAQSMAELHLSVLLKEDMKKKANAPKKASDRGTVLKEFLKPTTYKPLALLFGLFFVQQFSGIYITLFYAIHFFKQVDPNLNAYLASIFLGTVRFVMSLVNTYMLKRYQRRPLVVASCVGMALCMLVSGLYTKYGNAAENKDSPLKWAPVVLLVIYVITSMIGLLSIPWTMSAELFPQEIRGVAQSLSYSIANVLMFAAIQSYYPLEELFGGAAGIQWFFAAMSLVGLVFAYIFMPETHNKKLSEIVEYFENNTVYLTSKRRRRRRDDAAAADGDGEAKRAPIVKNRADDERRSDAEQNKNLMEAV